MTTRKTNCIAVFLCFFICIESHSEDPPKKLALLIGVSDYFDKKIKDLNYAENDVAKAGEALKALGFKVTTITGRQATKKTVDQNLDQFLETASKLENEDIVFVMFSGHGQQIVAKQQKKVIIKDKIHTITLKTESPFFCPRDAVHYDPGKHDLNGKTEEQIATNFNLISLNRVISGLDEKSNSRKNLLVVDACRDNPGKTIAGRSAEKLSDGISILFAAKSGQRSWESSNPKIKHGVMSYFLIEGLKGKAVNRRNEVTWQRLISHIDDELNSDHGKLAGDKVRTQNPQVIQNGSSHIVLGKFKARPNEKMPSPVKKDSFKKQEWQGTVGKLPLRLQWLKEKEGVLSFFQNAKWYELQAKITKKGSDVVIDCFEVIGGERDGIGPARYQGTVLGGKVMRGKWTRRDKKGGGSFELERKID